MSTIEQLCGTVKQQSDLAVSHIRNRYTQSTSVKSGNWFRMTLSKHDQKYVDMRSLKLRFNLAIQTADALSPTETGLAAPTAACIFRRIVVKSGSTVIMDIENVPLLATMQENISTKGTVSVQSLSLRGNGSEYSRRNWARDGPKEYIINAGPAGSFLNCDCLLPTFRMSDIHIEYYLADGNLVINSPDQASTFTISDIELHSNYLSSKSITNFFNANPNASFSVTDYSHRFFNVNGQTSVLKISSANTSLNSIVCFFHPDNMGDTTARQRYEHGMRYSTSIKSYQLFVNTLAYYDQPVDSLEQAWEHFSKSFPQAEHSMFYNDWDTQFLLTCDLRAAPKEFSKHITSGVKTSALNSDLALKVDFLPGGQAVPLVVDCFLMSDAVISIGAGRDLQIRY